MESFTVKTIKSVEYVKALDIANFYEKNKNNAGRFIRETFAEEDILKSNATLYVRKSAVETHMCKASDILDSKVQELDLKIREAQAAKRNFEEKLAKIEKFKTELVREYKKHIRATRLDEAEFAHLIYFVEQSPNFDHLADNFDESVAKEFDELKRILEEKPWNPNESI